MKIAELRGKSDSELAEELVGLAREAFNLRMQSGSGQAPRASNIRRVRKDIARVKTVLSQRRLGLSA